MSGAQVADLLEGCESPCLGHVFRVEELAAVSEYCYRYRGVLMPAEGQYVGGVGDGEVDFRVGEGVLAGYPVVSVASDQEGAGSSGVGYGGRSFSYLD